MYTAKKWGVRSTLAAPLMPGNTHVAVVDGHAARFFTGDHSDWYYLTIRHNDNFEVVKLVDVINGALVIERAHDQTEARQWPAGACIGFEWNPAQVCEHIRTCVLGFESAGIRPGTYCMECVTCIDVNKYGQITGIKKGDGC